MHKALYCSVIALIEDTQIEWRFSCFNCALRSVSVLCMYIYIHLWFFKEQVALSLVMRDTAARTVFTTLIYIYRAEKKITVFSHIVKLCLAIFLIDLLHLSNSA